MTYRVNGKIVTREEFLKGAVGIKPGSAKGMTVIFDRAEYVSPLTGKLVTSRRERREEMKRFEVREVDPSEMRARKEARLNQQTERSDGY